MKVKSNYLYPLATIVLLLVVWQALVTIFQVQSWLLPSPWEIGRTIVSKWDLLWQHSVYTLSEALLGLILATGFSLLLAFMMSAIPLLYRSFYPLLVISQTIPIIVLAPLFLVWFGYGYLPKVLVVILICFFPLVINVLAGFNAADPYLLRFYQSMGAKPLQMFRRIRLPAVLPYFFGGLRIAATYSIMGAVIGEWLGATKGIGLLLTRAQRSYDMPLVFASIVTIIFWSAVVFLSIRIWERLMLRWKGEQKVKQKTEL